MVAGFASGFAPRDGDARFPQLWKGCVGAWCPSLGHTGTQLIDATSYRNHGALNNMTLSTAWDLQAGQYGLTFDGTDDTVTFNTVAVLAISMWFKTTLNAQRHLIGLSSGNNNGILLNGSTSIRVGNQNAVGSFTVPSYTDGLWHHAVAIMPDLTTVGLWLDKISYGTASVTSGSTTVNVMGRRFAGSFFQGSLDDVRLYNRSLSQSDVDLLYAAGRGGAYELAQRGRRRGASGNRRRRVICGSTV